MQPLRKMFDVTTEEKLTGTLLTMNFTTLPHMHTWVFITATCFMKRHQQLLLQITFLKIFIQQNPCRTEMVAFGRTEPVCFLTKKIKEIFFSGTKIEWNFEKPLTSLSILNPAFSTCDTNPLHGYYPCGPALASRPWIWAGRWQGNWQDYEGLAACSIMRNKVLFLWQRSIRSTVKTIRLQ